MDVDHRSPSDNVLWIDLEMTDIASATKGHIMEVGVIFTGPTFELLEDTELPSSFHRILNLSTDQLMDCSEWSKRVHTIPRPGCNKSLFDLCLESKFTLEQVDTDLEKLIRYFSRGKLMMIAGSSIASDRAFIDAQLPRTSALLHHRMIDVSTILEMSKRMYPGFRPFVSKLRMHHHAHSAIADIVASLRLMHELQQTIFMPMLIISRVSPPGFDASMFSPGGLPPPMMPHMPMYSVPSTGPPTNFVLRQSHKIPQHILESKLDSQQTHFPTATFGFPL
jgi:oligoribonuclease